MPSLYPAEKPTTLLNPLPFFRHTDERGRYKLENLTSPNPRPNLVYEYNGYPAPAKGWRVNLARMEQLHADDRLHFPAKVGGRIMKKVYLHELEGQPMMDVWTDVAPLSAHDAERLGYPTQKPLSLLERIIALSSNAGDVVMDCFCGCGTTVTAAQKLGRQWVGIDVTAVAIGIIKSRLENSFPELKGKVYVDGFPTDLEGARQLFEIDPYRFQVWANTLVDAFPLTKKGADGGIDGWLNFYDLDDTPKRAVVQVKGGKVQVGLIRDFAHVVTREKAAVGFFLCMGDVTGPMRNEALKEGYWTDAGGRDWPKVQILTVPDLLSGKGRALYPAQDKASMLGYRAKKQDKPDDDQPALF